MSKCRYSAVLMRILAIQLNQPGDAVLTTPALRWLMQQGHEVHLLAQPLGTALLSNMPGLASVEALPRGSINVLQDIRRAFRYRRIGFDQAIIFSQCSERPALWAWLSGARERRAWESLKAKRYGYWGWINQRRHGDPDAVHIVEQHLCLAGADFREARNFQLEYQPPVADREWATGWLQQQGLRGRDYLLFHVAARWPSKYWPAANVIEFIKSCHSRLGLPVVLTTGGDPLETDFAREIIASAKPDFHHIGTLQINQLGALIQQAALFTGVDTMPMHLAAALKIPGVAIFGPTDDAIWGPWQSNLAVLRKDCRCLKQERRSCGKGFVSECLASVSAGEVLDTAAKRLAHPIIF
ncbi:MAG: glycosyltransferase family 9 protein [Methylacidiphilales bacterium]|nr:glycosyltransferase family 9 protein [Candidatus Methylacidiphilales bacterium]